MKKRIIALTQDIDKKEFYNLIVKAVDISSPETAEEIKDELLGRGFMIFYSDEYTVETCFKHRHQEVWDKRRELDDIEWK